MSFGFVAFHYPRPDQFDDFVERAHVVWRVFLDQPGSSSAAVWATQAAERIARGTRQSSEHVALRAVTTSGSPESVYLWLCQLRRVPYSYDLIDNFGHRSPRAPIVGLARLHCGQHFMTIFTLVDFDRGEKRVASNEAGVADTSVRCHRPRLHSLADRAWVDQPRRRHAEADDREHAG